MEEKLRELKLKKARLFSDIESLGSVSDKCATDFGRLEIDILLLKKEILRETKNTLDES